MGVKLGRLSFGFLNTSSLLTLVPWGGRTGASNCAEDVGSDDSLIHFTGFAMCPLTSHFLEITGLQESASDDESDEVSELPFLAAACHPAAG